MKRLMLPELQWSDDLRDEVAALKERFDSLYKPWDRPTPVYLYHYSKWVTSILESQTIRLYDVTSMEDKEEVLYPLRQVRESMHPYRNELPPTVVNVFHEDKRITLGSTWNAFESSFCEGQETAYMWREYADQGRGAAIHFNARELRSQPASHAVYPMTYDAALLRILVRDACRYALSRKWIRRFKREEKNVLAYRFCEHIVKSLLSTKRDCFRQESEWRALQLDASGGHHTDERGRRYIEIALSPVYVSAIVLGAKSSMSEAELKAFLDKTPYQHTDVLRSEMSLSEEDA